MVELNFLNNPISYKKKSELFEIFFEKMGLSNFSPQAKSWEFESLYAGSVPFDLPRDEFGSSDDLKKLIHGPTKIRKKNFFKKKDIFNTNFKIFI